MGKVVSFVVLRNLDDETALFITLLSLGGAVAIDVMGPTQAFDTGAAARSFQMLVTGLAQAKDAGIDPQAALAMLDWSKKEPA